MLRWKTTLYQLVGRNKMNLMLPEDKSPQRGIDNLFVYKKAATLE